MQEPEGAICVDRLFVGHLIEPARNLVLAELSRPDGLYFPRLAGCRHPCRPDVDSQRHPEGRRVDFPDWPVVIRLGRLIDRGAVPEHPEMQAAPCFDVVT